jgi:hypothetical protein
MTPGLFLRHLKNLLNTNKGKISGKKKVWLYLRNLEEVYDLKVGK